MTYRLEFSRRAESYLSKLDKTVQERFSGALRALAEDPFGAGTKRLHGIDGRSLRVGGWRVRYLVDTMNLVLNIESIAPRGQVYRRR